MDKQIKQSREKSLNIDDSFQKEFQFAISSNQNDSQINQTITKQKENQKSKENISITQKELNKSNSQINYSNKQLPFQFDHHQVEIGFGQDNEAFDSARKLDSDRKLLFDDIQPIENTRNYENNEQNFLDFDLENQQQEQKQPITIELVNLNPPKPSDKKALIKLDQEEDDLSDSEESFRLIKNTSLQKVDDEQFLQLSKQLREIERKIHQESTTNYCFEWLSLFEVPKRFAISTPCFSFSLSFLFCLLILTCIDFFTLVKYVVQIYEIVRYNQDYPKMVEAQVIVKSIIYFGLFSIQAYLINDKKSYWLCKLAYGLKFLDVPIIIWQAASNDDQLQEECNKWLSNPSYKFQRDSQASNSYRPMTMVFNCNFEQVFEDKTVLSTSETIKYYAFSFVMQNVFHVTEIFYCLACMILYIFIIYWYQQDNTIIITDQGLKGEQEDEEKLMMKKYNHKNVNALILDKRKIKIQKLEQLRYEKKQILFQIFGVRADDEENDRQNFRQSFNSNNSYYSSSSRQNGNSNRNTNIQTTQINTSRDSSQNSKKMKVLRQLQNYSFEKDNNPNNSFKSITYQVSQNKQQQKAIQTENFAMLPSNRYQKQDSMKFDQLFEAPSESWKIRKVSGSIQKDYRLKLTKRISKVSNKINISRKIKQKERMILEESSEEEEVQEDQFVEATNNQSIGYNHRRITSRQGLLDNELLQIDAT